MSSLWWKMPIPAPKSDLHYGEAEECGEPLVDITDWPRIHYAASYDQMHIPYAMKRCYVRERVSRMLNMVLESLPEDFSLLVFDSLRPYAVQKSLYDKYGEELRKTHPEADDQYIARLLDDFVAFPRIDYLRPTPHSTGGAIDLTLMRGEAVLNMGTDFDDLTSLASTDAFEGNRAAEYRSVIDAGLLQRFDHDQQEEIRKNRRLLYHAMIHAGFCNYANEWWHYSYGDRAWGAQNGKQAFYSYIEADSQE